AGDLAAKPFGRPDRPEQSFNCSRQLGGAYGVAEGAQDSRVLAVGIARRQPIGAMKFHSPAQELETVRRGLPVADEGADAVGRCGTDRYGWDFLRPLAEQREGHGAEPLASELL